MAKIVVEVRNGFKLHLTEDDNIGTAKINEIKHKSNVFNDEINFQKYKKKNTHLNYLLF